MRFRPSCAHPPTSCSWPARWSWVLLRGPKVLHHDRRHERPQARCTAVTTPAKARLKGGTAPPIALCSADFVVLLPGPGPTASLSGRFTRDTDFFRGGELLAQQECPTGSLPPGQSISLAWLFPRWTPILAVGPSSALDNGRFSLCDGQPKQSSACAAVAADNHSLDHVQPRGGERPPKRRCTGGVVV